MNDCVVFTPAAVLDLLSQIDELSDLTIQLDESSDGDIRLQIGSSTYNIDSSAAETVSIDEDAVDSIESVNDEAYDNLDEWDEFDVNVTTESVESGVLREIAKSLLLGGMIRLSAKLLH